MNKLYIYQGTVSSFRYDSKGCGMADLILGDISDLDKPPVRIAAHGALAEYINDINGTDAEERYMKADWYYSRNLYLHHIEIPSLNEYMPAKIITQADFVSQELVIFGPQEYIETREPKCMDDDQYSEWCRYRADHY